MIFDWKNKEEALKNGIEEKGDFSVIEPMVKSIGGVIENHTFCNFENLTFEEGAAVRNCIIEECGTVSFEDSKITNCEFYKTELIFTRDCDFEECNFSNIVADGGMAISLEDGNIRNCKFDNITLLENSYVVDGVGDCWIEECNFSNIRTSREDKEIIICEETVGKIFKKKKQFCIVDEDSCTGLNCIADLDGAIEIGSFDLM